MSCIHSYYIAPNFILIGGKLHRYKTSFVHLHQCCVNPGNFVRARVGPSSNLSLKSNWMTQHLYNFHYRQWFYNFFTNLCPCVEDWGSSPVNHTLRLSEITSNDSNMPESPKNFLVFQVILRITARIPYDYNILLRFVLHLIWLTIQKESLRFTRA